MSSTKGDRWERQYRNALCATAATDPDAYERVGVDNVAFLEEFTAVRMPSSGSGIDEDLPDLHVWLRAGPGDVHQFAVEVKAGAERVRLSNDEVAALRRFAHRTGAVPLVFVHIDKRSRHDDRGGDYVVHVDDLHSTAKGYTFTKVRDTADALTFAEWVTRPVSTSIA